MKKFILIFILTAPLLGKSQARLVFNNDAYLVIDNAVYLVVDNGNANAITTVGTGGNIISESETDVVQWNVEDNTGTYVVPFTTNTTKTKIPQSTTITNAGSVDGNIIFSTYETATDINTTYPSDVTTMFSSNLNGDGSLFAIDRFWRVDADAYTTKPAVTLAFGYDDAANEIVGTNTITEANLQAQRFRTGEATWGRFIEGTANTTTNVVSNIVVPINDFFKTWTLVDNSNPLPIDLLSFDAQKENNYAVLNWITANEENISHFDIERSSDGKEFAKIGEVKAGLEYVFHDYKPENGVNYYRLKIVGDDNSFSYSKVKQVIFGDDLFVSLFPNPTNSFSTLKITGEYKELQLTVYDLKGRLIKQASYANQNNIELYFVSDLADGMYHINISIDDYISKNIKLVKNK